MLRIAAPGITERPPLAVVLGCPVATVEEAIAKDGATLLAPHAPDADGPEFTSAARLISALFVADDAPELVLLLAGRWAVLAEQSRWAEGRYLAVDLQLVCERNDDQARRRDRPRADLPVRGVARSRRRRHALVDRVLEESVKHTVGVSQGPARGRAAVHRDHRQRGGEPAPRRAGLEPLPADRGAAAGQAVAAVPLPHPVPALRRGLPRARRAAGRCARVRRTATAWTGCASWCWSSWRPRRPAAGTHLYESLGVLFRLVDTGTPPPRSAGDAAESDEGLQFNALRADLFRPRRPPRSSTRSGSATPRSSRCSRHLLLSKEKRGKDRGFISYAELGINQLGAVYEGLMSYTGFFAETDLYEVAKGGDAEQGLLGGPGRPGRRHRRERLRHGRRTRSPASASPCCTAQGTFVFRLAGRERQQSASYYTPEVLTRFTVGQALEELLDQDGDTTTAAEILELTVCEPALGSGRVRHRGGPPARRAVPEAPAGRARATGSTRTSTRGELQKVKAYLALHNVYGVDLNATAVELAEISLWLDTMVAGLPAPWFGLHLRRGNSLIGARRAVYRRSQVNDKSWLTARPDDVPLTVAAPRTSRPTGSAPTSVTASTTSCCPPTAGAPPPMPRRPRDLAPDAAKQLKALAQHDEGQADQDAGRRPGRAGHRVEALWQIALPPAAHRRAEIRRAIPVWGPSDAAAPAARCSGSRSRQSLADAERRLPAAAPGDGRLVRAVVLAAHRDRDDRRRPRGSSRRRWTSGSPGCRRCSGATRRGQDGDEAPRSRTDSGCRRSSWDELATPRSWSSTSPAPGPIDGGARASTRGSRCASGSPQQQGFFHWELDFAPVFARGGFDLQVGNPPWVRPRTDVDALLAEGDPWWQLAVKPTEAAESHESARRPWPCPGCRPGDRRHRGRRVLPPEFVGSPAQYPAPAGLQPDLYRCFMEQTWRHPVPSAGSIGTHPSRYPLHRRQGWAASRARRIVDCGGIGSSSTNCSYFEIDDHKAVRRPRLRPTPDAAVRSTTAASLYHPDTVSARWLTTGPGRTRAQGRRRQLGPATAPRTASLTSTETVLATWHDHPGSRGRTGRCRLAWFTRSTGLRASALTSSPAARGSELSDSSSPEAGTRRIDRKKGYFETDWGAPDVVGRRHPAGSAPVCQRRRLYKTPNQTMLHNLDWSATDFETLATGRRSRHRLQARG